MFIRDSIHHRWGKNDKVSVNLLKLRDRTKANTKGNGRRDVKNRNSEKKH